MAETTAAETKKIVNPRVEIDTSPPFESVKEAVDRFGGSGPWIPHHLLRLASSHHHDSDEFDMEKMEEQTVQLERDLIMKEQQTLNVLKELESAKRFVEALKVNLIPELSSFMASPELKLASNLAFCNEMHSSEGLSLSPGLMSMELNQAKMNLNKTSVDLAVIQASIESLNKKLRKDKVLLEMRNKMFSFEENHCISDRKPDIDDQKVESQDISMTISKEMNFEAEQFKKMTEASRYEVMKAMTEIERTKNSIKMAEMRLNAAKKMEEAAKAVEAIALAERRTLSNSSNISSDGITLSFEEYRALTQKAQQAEKDLCKTKFIDTNAVQERDRANQLEVPVMEKFEETGTEGIPVQKNSNKFKFRNSHPGNGNEPQGAAREKSNAGFRSTTSIGDILSRKLIVQQDDHHVMVERHVENHSERQHISLSQMLREQSRLILHPSSKTTATDGNNVEKQYFVQRKKFGFIQVPIPTKQSKKKTQPLNMR